MQLRKPGPIPRPPRPAVTGRVSRATKRASKVLKEVMKPGRVDFFESSGIQRKGRGGRPRFDGDHHRALGIGRGPERSMGEGAIRRGPPADAGASSANRASCADDRSVRDGVCPTKRAPRDFGAAICTRTVSSGESRPGRTRPRQDRAPARFATKLEPSIARIG